MQQLEGKRKRKYTITFLLFDRKESPVVENTQKWVSSRDLDSLPIPVPCVISSQCLISPSLLVYLLLSVLLFFHICCSGVGQAPSNLQSVCVSSQSTFPMIPLHSVGKRDTSE